MHAHCWYLVLCRRAPGQHRRFVSVLRFLALAEPRVAVRAARRELPERLYGRARVGRQVLLVGREKFVVRQGAVAVVVKDVEDDSDDAVGELDAADALDGALEELLK